MVFLLTWGAQHSVQQLSCLAHKRLDEAVLAAFGCKSDLSDGHPRSAGCAHLHCTTLRKQCGAHLPDLLSKSRAVPGSVAKILEKLLALLLPLHFSSASQNLERAKSNNSKLLRQLV
jgi:hypothetical protein